MDYHHLYFTLYNGATSKQTELFEHLTSNGLESLPANQELLLSLALCNIRTSVRQAAKKVLKKHGNDAIKEALTLVPRRNYYSSKGHEHLKNNLPQLENVNGLNLVQLCKYLFLNESTLTTAIDYFVEHASEEELHFYFLHNCITYEGKDHVYLRFPRKPSLPGHVAQALCNAIPDLAPAIRMLEVRTPEPLELSATPPMPHLYELIFEAQLDTFPAHLFQHSSIHRLRIFGPFKKIPTGISQLKQLKQLTISAPIEVFPDDFFQLSNLEQLSLYDTQLEALPDDF
jgi:hypothetical protein